jgi:hypothetical protein
MTSEKKKKEETEEMMSQSSKVSALSESPFKSVMTLKDFMDVKQSE